MGVGFGPRGLPAKAGQGMGKISASCTHFSGPGGDLLSRDLRRSTIGARGLNDRVRDGIGWGAPAITTGSAEMSGVQTNMFHFGAPRGAPLRRCSDRRTTLCDEAMHSPSHMSFTIKPIEQLVPVSSTHHCASTPGLSTWWSTTALKGNLVLRWVSRLDAFSGYPVHT